MKLLRPVALTVAIASIASMTTGCGSAPVAAPAAPPAPAVVNPAAACLINLMPAPGQTQSPSIAFTGTGLTMTKDSIIGGTIPLADNAPELVKPTLMNGGKTAGTITITPGAATTVGQFSGSGVDGNIYLNVTSPIPAGSTFNGTPINATGIVNLSAIKLSTLTSYNPLTPIPGVAPIPNYPAQTPLCVTGMAISMSIRYNAQLYGGRVYLYIANFNPYPLATNFGTQGHGTYLQF